MEHKELLQEIKSHVQKNGGMWDLTDDNGTPIIHDEKKDVMITDIIISKDDIPCAVIPLGYFSEETLNAILNTM